MPPAAAFGGAGRARRTVAGVLRPLSWGLLAVAASVAPYALFAHWAVNAASLGQRDMGWALFFAISGAWALIACYWLVPVAVVAAVVAGLARRGSAWVCALAAALGALPFLSLR